MATKIVKNSEKRKPPAAGKGRPKGAINKNTAAVKDMIKQALEEKGGVTYLKEQADEHPVAFLALLGRILPTEIKGSLDSTVVIKVVTGV